MMTDTLNLQAETVELIKELSENAYAEEDMYVFINEHSEDEFVKFYEAYVALGEVYHYEPVDAYISEMNSLEYALENFEEAYRGEYSDFEEFATQYFEEVYAHEIPEHLQFYIDLKAFARDLAYDYSEVNGYIFQNI